jgi:hypothetical protein
MKIRLPVHATLTEKGHVFLKEANTDGKNLINRIFKKKREWEERNQKEYYLLVEFDLRYQERTFKQLATVFKLVEVIWVSMEGEPPTEEEKYSLYNDLLYVYADKKINRFTGEKIPVRISESNSIEGARFIDGLLYHLATMCELDYDTQSTVVGLLIEWEDWRGGLEIDPMDYADFTCTQLLAEAEWRERHRVSEASGMGGVIVLHHIVTRGSNKAAENKTWNWLALLHDEHSMVHERGDEYFLSVYPHLKGKFSRARKMANNLLHGGIVENASD